MRQTLVIGAAEFGAGLKLGSQGTI